MKLDVKEIYSLQLDREELEVLFNLIGKVTLGPDNPPIVQEVIQRFKRLRAESVESSAEISNVETSSLQCDGCESAAEDIEILECPATHEDVPLCPTCYLHRKHLPL